MPAFLSIVTTILPILFISFPFTTASPTAPLHHDLHQKRSSFTLHQVQKGYIRNGAAEVAKAFAKYGKRIPPDVLAAAVEREAQIASYDMPVNGSVPADPANEFDGWYLAPVTVGNDVLQLNLDTGSADLWVYSSLQEHTVLDGHDYYHVESGQKLENHTWGIRYMDGSQARGLVYVDKVDVGGVTAKSQAIGAATAVSSSFLRDKDSDGLMGLGFGSINSIQPTPQKTFFENVLPDLLEPVFAANLKYHAPGTYDFGYIDREKYTGDITYVDVAGTDDYWDFVADGYAIGEQATVLMELAFISDTGTTLTFLPAELVGAYYGKVEGALYDSSQGGYVFPCDSALPDFSVVISGVKQTMPGKYANFGPLDATLPTCFGGIQDGDHQFSVLGDTFLKSKYVIHELRDGKARLGFAQQVGVQSVIGECD